ncbi:unnamed protein product [Protopolystoma xenopodis]|uniref:Uncharacterized protein n=1 Tax=Protopolystoma xenopodis TaxID=117903 RepID=A0A3S5CVP4_9PLAT|nr:unnamed protein product [Protopolystoma xenopodis]
MIRVRIPKLVQSVLAQMPAALGAHSSRSNGSCHQIPPKCLLSLEPNPNAKLTLLHAAEESRIRASAGGLQPDGTRTGLINSDDLPPLGHEANVAF